ncbi:NAD(P)/FAD-dependent oxidoreductase [Candidatus Gottesmanbacteria bacterium]|nr:NAD(P)/FAD-dependent oxidoreductase [Candidatus Gottesmanbacteria bacterium]
MMNIAIIGAGLTGLTAAYKLVKQGHQVTVFEKEKTLGGLAGGFRQKGWDWHLESAYHHLFTNDDAILDLVSELGLSDKLILTRPITANYISKLSFDSLQTDRIIPFDSPLHLLTYPGLSLLDKLRTGMLLASIKANPFWQPLEWITAKNLFLTIGGKRAWQALWEPLMIGKFGPFADCVAASWLWARIKKRTQKLYYIEGGFHTLVSALEQFITQHGGIIMAGTSVESIQHLNSSHPRAGSPRGEAGGDPVFMVNWILGSSPRMTKKKKFDKVLLTIPTPIAAKLASPFSILHSPFSSPIPHLHAQTLILETKEPILRDTYWLNIMDRSFPFLAVVAHTNMIDKKHYGGHHLTYFGNYLPDGHPYLSMTKKQLLKVFLPYIKRLNPSFHWSDWSDLFIGRYAQPVHELHYSKRAPKLETSIPGVFLANVDSIYPWDRGTNYAVELGQKAANMLMSSRA